MILILSFELYKNKKGTSMLKILIIFTLITSLNSQDTKIVNEFRAAVKKEVNVNIDVNKSELNWLGGLKYNVKDHFGKISIKNGRFKIDENNSISGKLIVDMNSISNEDVDSQWKQNLINHLKSEDFFNVKKFNTAIIEITSSKIIEKLDNNNLKVQVDAFLIIKSIKNKIRFYAEVDFDSPSKSAKGKMIFDRNDFEIQYRSEMHLYDSESFWNKIGSSVSPAMDKIIKDNIEIDFNIVSKPLPLLIN